MQKMNVRCGLNPRLKWLIAILSLAFLMVFRAVPAEISLVWDPSPDTAVVGYNLYWGTASRTYTQKKSVGNVTSATVTNLVEGVTYYFAATAYDTWGLESDYSEEAVYTVPVTPVNQAPTLDSIANRTIPENNGELLVPLSGIASGMVSGTPVITVSATSSNPGLIPNPVISYQSPAATGTLKMTPVAFASGTSTITVTVRNNSPTNNTVSKTFVVTVYAVNQPPTLAALKDVAILEDSGAVTVNLSGIGSGAANENQTLTVAATSSNTGLIPAPTIQYTSPGSTGTLTLRPAANNYGTTVISVSVRDGGVSNNIVTQAFTVTVSPVNDAPTINPLSNLSLALGSGPTTVPFSGVSSGATNEAQSLTVTASSSNPALIPNPVVSYSSPSTTGTLTLTPSSGSGSAVISVTVSDGAAENSTRTVTFTAVLNNPPTISDVAHFAVALGSNVPPVSFTVSDPDTASQNLTVTATSSDPTFVPASGLVVQGTGATRSLSITPVAGKTGVCTITLTVTDGTSSTSDTFDFAVQKRPASPGRINVMVQGFGSVSPALPEGMVEGQTYTLLATPAAGQVFAGWSGSVASTSPTLKVTTFSGMQLIAKFVPSPYPAVANTYYGLFYEPSVFRQESSGSFACKTTSRGNYSGYVQIGAFKMPFVGKLGLDCKATNTIKGPNGTTLTLLMTVNSDGSTPSVTGTLSDGMWGAELAAQRTTVSGRTVSPWTGLYTFVLPGQSADALLPFGHSYGTMKVSASGLTMLAGKLADGSSFSRTCRLTDSGLLPLYVPLYAGKGALISWVGMEDRVADDLHGEAHWVLPAGVTANPFQAGFNYAVELAGCKYTKPLGGFPCVALQNNTASFSLNGMEIDRPIQVGIPLYTVSGADGISLLFSHASGSFKGKVLDSATGTTATFGGVVLQKQNAGFGLVKTTDSIGRATLY